MHCGRHLVPVEGVAQALHEAAVEQLQRGDVDGDAYRRPGRGAPARGVLDRRLDHPLADLADEAAILGNRQESLRRGMAAVGQAPAQQRLDEARLAGREVDLRLEMELELAAVDGAAQALLGGELGRRRLEQLRAEHAHAAAALRLGVEQRGVGRAQQAFRVAAVRREQARAEAEAHQELAPVDDEWLLEALHQPVRGALDVRGRIARARRRP